MTDFETQLGDRKFKSEPATRYGLALALLRAKNLTAAEAQIADPRALGMFAGDPPAACRRDSSYTGCRRSPPSSGVPCARFWEPRISRAAVSRADPSLQHAFIASSSRAMISASSASLPTSIGRPTLSTHVENGSGTCNLRASA